MTLVILVFLGGVLTIVSPCILPVLPFVFARSEQKFLTNGLPMLAGMAITFAAIATLAAVGGSWAVSVNQYGRMLCARVADRVRGDAVVEASGRLAGAPVRRAGQSADASGFASVGSIHVVEFPAAGRCDRTSLGAVRRPDFGPHSDRRSNIGSECTHHTVAVCLRRGRRDLVGGGAACRRTSVCVLEEIAGNRRVDQTRAGRRGAGSP